MLHILLGKFRLLCPILSNSHLFTLTFICHASIHCSMLQTSTFIFKQSSMELTLVYSFESSAYKTNSENLTWSGKSLMCSRKNRATRIVPCGILLTTGAGPDITEPTLTRWVLLRRKFLIHTITLPPNPRRLSFMSNFSWEIVSNALATSIYKTFADFLLFTAHVKYSKHSCKFVVV